MDSLMHDDWKAEMWPVTFVGGTADVKGRSPDTWQPANSSTPLLPLAMTTVGDRVWVIQIRGGHRMVRRLTDLGIVQGCEVTIISRTGSGSVVVALQGCRIGLGAGMAHQVMVSPHPPSTTPQFSESQSATESETDAPALASPAIGETAVTESTETLTLAVLAVGQSGCISGYASGSRAYRSKLLAMGLTPGTAFTVTRHAPLGDPIEIDVRGFKLSLRKSEAAVLQVSLTL